VNGSGGTPALNEQAALPAFLEKKRTFPSGTPELAVLDRRALCRYDAVP
jgi:hypothetical protein